MTQRPDVLSRGNGAGVAPHTDPDSSSLRKIASPVGSPIGSFANGVRRFSRLFTDHVNAEPDALTIVPNSGFARMFDHGNGVSRSPSRTTTYSLPPSPVNPPNPFSMTSAGCAMGTDAGSGTGSAALLEISSADVAH